MQHYISKWFFSFTSGIVTHFFQKSLMGLDQKNSMAKRCHPSHLLIVFTVDRTSVARSFSKKCRPLIPPVHPVPPVFLEKHGNFHYHKSIQVKITFITQYAYLFVLAFFFSNTQFTNVRNFWLVHNEFTMHLDIKCKNAIFQCSATKSYSKI